jgi:hypothetical protein
LITTYRALGGGWDYRLDPASNTAPGLGTPRPEVVPAVPPRPIEHLPPPALEQR